MHNELELDHVYHGMVREEALEDYCTVLEEDTDEQRRNKQHWSVSAAGAGRVRAEVHCERVHCTLSWSTSRACTACALRQHLTMPVHSHSVILTLKVHPHPFILLQTLHPHSCALTMKMHSHSCTLTRKPHSHSFTQLCFQAVAALAARTRWDPYLPLRDLREAAPRPDLYGRWLLRRNTFVSCVMTMKSSRSAGATPAAAAPGATRSRPTTPTMQTARQKKATGGARASAPHVVVQPAPRALEEFTAPSTLGLAALDALYDAG